MQFFDSDFRLSAGSLELSGTWQTVVTNFWYADSAPMVVFAQPIYADGPPAMIQIRDTGGRTFQIRAFTPGDGEAAISCMWFAVPAGRWDFDGHRIEVMQVESESADRSGSLVGQALPTTGTFTKPSVIGQVQTANDAWSVFWSSGAAVGSPPAASGITVGRHIGGDPNTARVRETLGVLVSESGVVEINGVVFEAGTTTVDVPGFGGNPHTHLIEADAQIVVGSQAGNTGLDGAWAVVSGSNTSAVSNQEVRLFVDEDTLADAERGHSDEAVGYVALDGRKDAARFLAQAAWGGTPAQAADMFRRGVQGWIDDQLATTMSSTVEYLDSITALQFAEVGENTGLTMEQQQAIRQGYAANVAFTNAATPHATNFSTIWARNIIFNEDQLRQRVAWILSQIMVISGNGGLIAAGASVGSYFDGLAEHALGNFRDLIGHVSFHPAMAWFLSSLGNQKASDDGTRQPDENYARELMQLFTIGLWDLDPDGSPQLDDVGEPIPSYTNDDITELARVFTGFWYEGRNWEATPAVRQNQGAPPRRSLAMFEDRHDRGSKRLFAGKPWEFNLPAETDGVADINAALDGIFNHPNVGPFIARHLIQFMVMSNPPAAYVERVAAKFNNNGAGVRGDMAAVVRQVLVDVQARAFWSTQDAQMGKMQEPMVRIMQMIRGFGAAVPTDAYPGLDPEDVYFWRWPGAQGAISQWPMFAPSVFNFFQPDNPLGGSFRDQDIVAPELQLLNPVSAATLANELQTMIDWRIQTTREDVTPSFEFNKIDLAEFAGNPAALLDHLDLTLCRGLMSDATRSVILDKLDNLGAGRPYDQLIAAMWIAAISPEAVVLR